MSTGGFQDDTLVKRSEVITFCDQIKASNKAHLEEMSAIFEKSFSKCEMFQTKTKEDLSALVTANNGRDQAFTQLSWKIDKLMSDNIQLKKDFATLSGTQVKARRIVNNSQILERSLELIITNVDDTKFSSLRQIYTLDAISYFNPTISPLGSNRNLKFRF